MSGFYQLKLISFTSFILCKCRGKCQMESIPQEKINQDFLTSETAKGRKSINTKNLCTIETLCKYHQDDRNLIPVNAYFFYLPAKYKMPFHFKQVIWKGIHFSSYILQQQPHYFLFLPLWIHSTELGFPMICYSKTQLCSWWHYIKYRLCLLVVITLDSPGPLVLFFTMWRDTLYCCPGAKPGCM